MLGPRIQQPAGPTLPLTSSTFERPAATAADPEKESVHPDDFHAPRDVWRGYRDVLDFNLKFLFSTKKMLRNDLNGVPHTFVACVQHIFKNSAPIERPEARQKLKVAPK